MQMHQTLMGFRRDNDALRGKKVERALLRRVLGLTRPYRGALIGFLVTVVARRRRSASIPALLFRALLDDAVGSKNETLVLVPRARGRRRRRRQRGPEPAAALVLRQGRRGPHLRHAGRAVRPRAAPADLVLHPRPDRRAA